jgi:replicative DNA helicase
MNSIKPEQQLIGGLLHVPSMLDELPDLEPCHFMDSRMGHLYKTICQMQIDKKEINGTSVNIECGEEWTEHAIVECIEARPASGFVSLANQVKSNATRRKIHAAATTIAELCKTDRNGDSVAISALDIITEAANIGTEPRLRLLTDILSDAMHSAMEPKGKPLLIPTGIASLDEATGGFPRGLVTIIAARPAAGKSAFLVNMIMNVANADNTVMFSSLEDTNHYVGLRILSRFAKVNARKLSQQKELDFYEAQRMRESIESVKSDNVYSDDGTGQSVNKIRRTATRLKAKGALDILFVDHLGELGDESNVHASTNKNIKGLRDIAKSLDIPVVVAAQLNREAAKRDKKVPGLTDLRDSGKIEEVARNIWFLHRPHYYDEMEDPRELQVIIAKASHGITGKKTLDVDLDHMTVSDRIQDERY